MMRRKRLRDEKIGYTSGHKKAARYKGYRTALGDQPDRWSYDQYSILFHKGGVRITRTPTLAFAKYEKQPMSEQAALVPTEIRTVEFYGDEITGALVQVTDEARIYVPIRPICEYLGLSWGSQYNRIKRDEVLNAELRGVFIMKTPQGGTQETLCLPLEMLPGFLFGLTPGKVRQDLQEKIIRYRRECYRRLWDAFKNDILQSVTLTPPPQTSGAALAYELATAVQNLAREQMEFETRVDDRFGRVRTWARTIEIRVAALETLGDHVNEIAQRVNPQEPINEAQRTEIQLAVKNVGYALEQRGVVPGYPRVYAEMYRRYGISSYKNLPQGRYDEALQWLHDWHNEIVAGSTE